ncbi:MAG: hypothetical protein ACO3LF_06265 [Candidatus Kariarchaeum pelagius]
MTDNLHEFLEQQFSNFTGTPITLKNGFYSSITINKIKYHTYSNSNHNDGFIISESTNNFQPHPSSLSIITNIKKEIINNRKHILSLSHGKNIENNKKFSNPIIVEDSHKRLIALCKIKDNMLIPIIDIGMYLRLE